MNTRSRSCKNLRDKRMKDASGSIMPTKATLAQKDMSLTAGNCEGEDVYIPSQRVARLNIFGMIDRDNRYKGFTTSEKMTADKIVSFLDEISFNLKMDRFVVLDNASVHRNKKIRELRPIWEQRGLFLFYLPPYSPQLNIAETLWRILKGKWMRPQDYITSDMLFYTTNRALADIGKGLRINFSKHVA